MSGAGRAFVLTLVPCLFLLLGSCWATEGDQPYELVGYFEGACHQKAGVFMDNSKGGNTAVRCLPEGHVLATPLAVLYTVDDQGLVTFTWWEDSVTVSPFEGGPAYSMEGGQDSSLSLTMFHVDEDDKGPSFCVNATFDTFKAAYRAAVVRVGDVDIYTEDAVYSKQDLSISQTCPARDNMALYCDDQSFNYRCWAQRVDQTPAQMAARLQQVKARTGSRQAQGRFGGKVNTGSVLRKMIKKGGRDMA